jgi:hypothetical protein
LPPENDEQLNVYATDAGQVENIGGGGLGVGMLLLNMKKVFSQDLVT